MQLTIPAFSMVMLYGASGAGKSTFARKHFRDTEILSSDRFRAMVCDDENDQSVTPDAFRLLHEVATSRLKQRRLTVIDATNLTSDARKPLLKIARINHCPVVGVVLDLPLKQLLKRRQIRDDRNIPEEVLREHYKLAQGWRKLKSGEGLQDVHHLAGTENIEAACFLRHDPWHLSRSLSGPFDLIGDVHGCYDELCQLMEQLGYRFEGEGEQILARHPEGRLPIFLGDLVDRGPKVVPTLQLVFNLIDAGLGFCVPGNHEMKLARKLKGNDVTVRHGLEVSLQQLESAPDELKQRVIRFCEETPNHLIFDGEKLVAVHAGILEPYIGRNSKKIWAFAMYGDVTGDTDEQGFPVRKNWADRYQGEALVAYGHTPVQNPTWHNNTICLDTGCVFGGELTALRYPERELVSVPAITQHYTPSTTLKYHDN